MSFAAIHEENIYTLSCIFCMEEYQYLLTSYISITCHDYEHAAHCFYI